MWRGDQRRDIIFSAPYHHDVLSTSRRPTAARPFGSAAVFFYAWLGLVLLGAPTAAQDVVSARAALERQRSAAVTIVDIRRPDEWRKTGVPAGAARATIRSPLGNRGFLDRIAEITGGDRSKPIALICAAGVRSRHAAKLLREEGYTRVSDIHEGMFGSGSGPGWLDRGLPTEACPNC